MVQKPVAWWHPQSVVKAEPHEAGSTVTHSGYYVCVPCGYKKFLQKGDVFPSCIGCVKNTKDKGDIFARNLGLWEFI